MQLLMALKFVQGAVARKDFVPALTHFRISNGTVRGFNGALAISSPIDLDLDVSPAAVPFVKAISACNETIALHVAANGKLVIRSGAFRANIDTDAPANFPDIRPSGAYVNLPDDFLPALAYLEPFIAEDASRPWACGILFDGQYAYATNNIVLVQYWLGFNFPSRVNIPANAVRELLRIGKSPVRLQVSDTRLTFHYGDGAWVSTTLFESQWPDTNALLDRHLEAPVHEVAPAFWAAVEQVLPFADELGRCYFNGSCIATGSDPELAGYSVAVSCPESGIFNIKQLFNLRAIVKQIGFASYPNPVPFFGERSRGIIVGLRS